MPSPRPHLPFLPIYVHDFLSSTEGMPLEALGAYTVLLYRAWDSGGRLPDDDEALAGLSRLGILWPKYSSLLRSRFSAQKGCLTNRKLRKVYLEQLALYRKRQKAGSLGGRTRASNAQAVLKQRLSDAQAEGKQPEPDPEPDPEPKKSIYDGVPRTRPNRKRGHPDTHRYCGRNFCVTDRQFDLLYRELGPKRETFDLDAAFVRWDSEDPSIDNLLPWLKGRINAECGIAPSHDSEAAAIARGIENIKRGAFK